MGYAVATALAREGARVIVNGRTQTAVNAAMAAIKKTVDIPVQGFAGDLTSVETAEQLAYKHPDIEILVNNLGIYEAKDFEEITDPDWLRHFTVNVLSGVRLSRLCLTSLKRANWRRIIFISSENGVQIPAKMIHYGVTKAAQLALSRGLAGTLAGTGITVNCILPGPTRSRGVNTFVDTLAKAGGRSFAEFEKEFFEKIRPTSLTQRFAALEEVASLVTYIASPLASATTGAALRVDGSVIKCAF